MRTNEYRCKRAICPPDAPRNCTTCPEWTTTAVRCDQCGEYAEYHWDGEDWCEDCLKDTLISLFAQQPLSDMAEMLDVGISSTRNCS